MRYFHSNSHNHQIDESQRHEVLPLQLQNLVDTQTWERPLDPHQNPNQEEGLTHKPHDTGDVVHHSIEGLYTNVHRRPTTEEYRSGNTCDDEEVEELSEVEEAEAHTGILSMVAGGQLTLSLSHIERATVSLSVTGNEEYEEGDDGRNVSLEDEPFPRACICMVPVRMTAVIRQRQSDIS